MKESYDIGIVGNWSTINYGAHLTYYALYSVLTELGYDVLMIESTMKLSDPNLTPGLFIENPYPEENLCPVFPDITAMKMLNEKIDTFVTGSDQLWVWRLFWYTMDVYSLSFVDSDKRKISYATSLGDPWQPCTYEQQTFLKYMLRRFQKISVREKFSEEYCKEKFSVEATCVLDPVFLCEEKRYIELLNKSRIKEGKPYLFCYIIWPNERNADFIKKTAQKYDLEIVCIGTAGINFGRYDNWGIPLKEGVKVEDWLKLIYESELVITDSFHAFSFSLIFEKKVIPLGLEDCLERTVSLSSMLGMKKPLTYSESQSMTDQELLDYYTQDFMSIRKNLDFQKQRSKKWLTDALQCQVNPKENDFFWDEFGMEFIENRKKIADLNRSYLKTELKSDVNYHNIIAFGTGYCYKKYFYEIEQALGFDYCCDNDEQKWGTDVQGKRCLSPGDIVKLNNPYVIIMIISEETVKEISNQLNEMGVNNIISVHDFLSKIRWM